MAQDVAFTQDLHDIWATLYKKLWPRIEGHACEDYLKGAKILKLPEDRIPTVDYLNSKITPNTGWTVERTHVRYTDANPWYKKFNERIFLITDYMRSWKEIDWTPEPDMWHDIFGHLPFMVLKHYAELEEMFAPAFLAAQEDEQRENIKRLAWFSTEFGLIREKGEIKVFGAGHLSSAAEMDRVASGEVPVQEFVCEDVIAHAKSVWEFNSILFVADSLQAYHDEVKRYFDAMPDAES